MDPSIYRLRQQDILSFCVLALLCLGAVMVQSASMNVTGKLGFGWTPMGTKQAMFCVVAVMVFMVVGRMDYSPLARPAVTLRDWMMHPVVWLVIVTIVLNLAVLVPGIGISKNGARRWLPLGFMQLQPSELAKWACVIFLAWWLANRPLDTDKFFRGFLPTLVPIGMLCLVVVIQDFGTAALIAICGLTMLLAGRIKLWHLAVLLPPVACAGFWFVYHKSYRWTRMTAFVDPWAHPQKEGYHMIQSLLSFSTGGVTGKGIGNGIQKLGYLPEDTTDFIFAVICEELGLFGALLTVALYLGIIYVAWQALKNKKNEFSRLLAFGIGSMIGLQATINIAVATVSVPTKGLSLPLVSAGGSGLVITCAALGLLFSITRGKRADRPMQALTPFDLINPETCTDPAIG